MFSIADWLARLRHDVIKQAVWRARDLRDAKQAPSRADLDALRRALTALATVDDEGLAQRTTALSLFQLSFRKEIEEAGSPDPRTRRALDEFAEAIRVAESAVCAEDV